MAQARRRGILARLLLATAAAGVFTLAYQWGGQYQRPQQQPAIAGARIDPAQALPAAVAGQLAGLDAASAAPAGRAWLLLGLDEPASAAATPTAYRLIEVYNRLADRPERRAALALVLVSGPMPSEAARRFGQIGPAFQLIETDRADAASWHSALGVTAAGDPTSPPTLFLIDPQARLIALFPARQSASAIADDLTALVADHQP